MNNRGWMVDDGLALLLKVSRLCGTAPVRFEKQFGKVVKFSRPYHYFSVLLGLSVCICYAIAIANVFYESENTVLYKNAETVSYKSILTYIKILKRLNLTLLLCYFIYTTFLNKNRLGEILCCYSRISQVKKDIFFKEIKYSSALKKWHIGLILSGFTIVLGALVLLSAQIFDRQTFFEICLVTLSMAFWFTMSLQFVLVAHCANSALANINNTLEAILCDLSDSPGSDTRNPIFCLESIDCKLYIPISNINRAIDLIGHVDEMYPNVNTRLAKFAFIIEQLCCSHVRVSGVVRDMNNIESYNFVMYIFQFFIYITWTIFDCIVMLQSDEDNWKMIFIHALRIASHVLKFLPLIEVCQHTGQRVAHTRVLLGKMMMMSMKSPLMADAADAFFSYLMLNDVSFLVFNICRLDRTVFFSILGCSTTFIALLFC